MQVLRGYQEKCLEASDLARANGVTRQLWVLATGCGKTSLISEYLRRNGCAGTLGLMHREELLSQAAERIQGFNPTANIETEKAELRAVSEKKEVVLASVQTVGREGSNRLPPREWLRTLWIDEAHHAPADGYLRVVDYFGLRGTGGKDVRRDAMLIGTTATPDRLDGMGYVNLFDDVTFRYDLPDAIRDGWLADVRAWRIENDLDLQGVHTRGGDYVQGELSEAVQKSNLTARAVQTWENHSRQKSSIFFCVDKDHVATTAEALELVGATVATVTDDTPKDDRNRLVALYKAGLIECLINCAVFTEGFDAPHTNAIYMLRPTKSRSLYMQCVGRGTRKAPGKDHVDVFDCTLKNAPVQNLADIFGLPDAWDLRGQSLIDDEEELRELQKEMQLDLTGLESLAELKTVKKRIELFRAGLSDRSIPGSALVWMKGIGTTLSIGWRNPTRESKLPDHIKLMFLAANLPDKLLGQRESIEVKQNELGMWEAIHSGPEGTKRLDVFPMQRQAIAFAEATIGRHRPHAMPILRRGGAWRSQPATDAQKKFLKQKGVPVEMIGLATKSEASSLIDMDRGELAALFGGAA